MSQEAAQIAQLLSALTQPDTNAIREAEKQLKPILKDARCVPALVEVLKAQGQQVRTYVCINHYIHLFQNHGFVVFSWLAPVTKVQFIGMS